MSWPKWLKKADSRVATPTAASCASRPCRGEDLRRVRQDVDADAYRLYLRGSLVDLTVDARVVQFESQRQPSDPGSDNGELHIATMPAGERARERAAANSAERDDV